jgi:hypothetical protein
VTSVNDMSRLLTEGGPEDRRGEARVAWSLGLSVDLQCLTASQWPRRSPQGASARCTGGPYPETCGPLASVGFSRHLVSNSMYN